VEWENDSMLRGGIMEYFNLNFPRMIHAEEIESYIEEL
jgi:hypothetical protein